MNEITILDAAEVAAALWIIGALFILLKAVAKHRRQSKVARLVSVIRSCDEAQARQAR